MEQKNRKGRQREMTWAVLTTQVMQQQQQQHQSHWSRPLPLHEHLVMRLAHVRWLRRVSEETRGDGKGWVRSWVVGGETQASEGGRSG